MYKRTTIVLLAAMYVNPVTVLAQSSTDCSMAKFMAGHALTVIKGGATLEQALGMFEANGSTTMIITEIYSRKDSLQQKKDAEMIGVNICMKGGAEI